jgi:hypothetical protein
MSSQDLGKDPDSVDVTSPDTHNQVQCVELRLLSSKLQPLKKLDENPRVSHFRFKIVGSITGDTAFSELHVQVIFASAENAKPSIDYELQFILLGIFVSDGTLQTEALAEFVRMYTLSIFWPYAREYTSDQLRRAGQRFDSLPIINPQVVTRKLIDGKLVKVKIRTDEKNKSS